MTTTPEPAFYLPKRARPCLVLALGNDLLGDDAVGPIVAREVANRIDLSRTEVVESGEAGLALLELIVGYETVVVVDAIQVGDPPGTISVLGPEDFQRVVGPSAHYAGLPEVLSLGARLGLELPINLHVVAIEVADPYHFRDHLTPDVAAAVDRAAQVVAELTV